MGKTSTPVKTASSKSYSKAGPDGRAGQEVGIADAGQHRNGGEKVYKRRTFDQGKFFLIFYFMFLMSIIVSIFASTYKSKIYLDS